MFLHWYRYNDICHHPLAAADLLHFCSKGRETSRRCRDPRTRRCRRTGSRACCRRCPAPCPRPGQGTVSISEPPVYSLHAPLTSTALSAAASGPSILSLMSAAAVCLACSRHTGHRCRHHHPHLELYGLLLLLALAAALLVLVLAAPGHPGKVK